MRFVRRYSFLVSFSALLVFCSLMVLRQYHLNETRHIQIREAFILLHAKGYEQPAQRLYRHLIESLPGLSTQSLYDDFQRTMMLVENPSHPQPRNLVWRYHASVGRELETRSEKNLTRALKLAEKY